MGMIEYAAQKLTNQIQNASPNIDVEIVKYYYIRVINNLIFYLICIPLIILLDLNPTSSLILWMSYILLRRCFGGAHLETYMGCLILSVITMIGATWLVDYIKITLGGIIGTFIFTLIIVRWTGLVDSPKKRIIKLRDYFIKQGYITIGILTILTLILYYVDEAGVMCSAVIMGIFIELVSLILGKVTYK